jgi:hypothetical protein
MAAQTIWIEDRTLDRQKKETTGRAYRQKRESIQYSTETKRGMQSVDLQTGIEYTCICRESGGRCSKKCIYNLV